ncbi:hypothetical protein RIF29_39255 [Crotalaria pallida]|uniref:B-like cyclin n=1 Tax=Crotalaria pallida TaxID=3830 RepID=A0AAN9E3W1_CROPI
MASEEPEFNPPDMETINEYLATESYYMPTKKFYSDSTNLKIRKLAVSVIAKYWTVDIDAFVPYLAMNYFDNYISILDPDEPYFYYDIEKVRLIAITCLVMATKMREFSHDSYVAHIFEDFKREVVAETAVLIDKKLEFFMKPVTPFSFLDFYYFPSFVNIGGFKRRCINEIIVQAQGENDFVKYNYKSSDIAFSSFLAATRIAYPSIDVGLFRSPAGVTRCDEKLYELCNEKGIKIERASSSSATVGIKIGGQPEEAAAAKTETESHQQRPGKAVAETASTEIEAAMTESYRKRQAKGKAVAETSTEIEPAVTESYRKRQAKGKAVARTEIEEEGSKVAEKKDEEECVSEKTAPKRLMDFKILWPTDDPFVEKEPIDESPMVGEEKQPPVS